MYPTLIEVDKADHVQICSWYRFLPSPITKEQTNINNAIFKKYHDGGGMNTALSKAIGWGN